MVDGVFFGADIFNMLVSLKPAVCSQLVIPRYGPLFLHHIRSKQIGSAVHLKRQ